MSFVNPTQARVGDGDGEGEGDGLGDDGGLLGGGGDVGVQTKFFVLYPQ